MKGLLTLNTEILFFLFLLVVDKLISIIPYTILGYPTPIELPLNENKNAKSYLGLTNMIHICIACFTVQGCVTYACVTRHYS